MNYKTVGFKRVSYPHENKMRVPTLENDYIYIYVCVCVCVCVRACVCIHILTSYLNCVYIY